MVEWGGGVEWEGDKSTAIRKILYSFKILFYLLQLSTRIKIIKALSYAVKG